MAQRLLTFADIVAAVREHLGLQSSDLSATNKIKRFVNMYYIDEVVPFKRWPWLAKTSSVVHKAYYSTGRASVTPESTTVTLSIAPNVSLGSFKDYKFSVNGSGKVYTISAHTAASTSITLSGAFQESLNAIAEYKIWRDRFNLPTDAKETVELWHAEQGKTLTAEGPQGLRKLEATDPKCEGFPTHYSTTDFYDPSSSTGETESDRYRQVRIWPAINATPVTINFDYIQEVTELNDDADEPVLPVSDRIVLFYGACAMAYSVLNRNEEMHDKMLFKAMEKLKRMAGDHDEGFDAPALTPKSKYVNSIRKSGLKRGGARLAVGGGSSSVALPTYLAGVTLNGANVTGNVTVTNGITIDGRDISVDGATLDSLATPTSVTLTDNTTNQIVISWAVATFDSVQLWYTLRRGTARERGIITLISDGTSVSITQGNVAALGTMGVTLTADVSAGLLRLKSTTSATGTAATFKYTSIKWLTA